MVPMVDWTQNYLLSEWIKYGSERGLPTLAIAFLCTSVAYATLVALSTPIYFYFFLHRLVVGKYTVVKYSVPHASYRS